MRFSRGLGYQWGLFKRKISSKSLEPFLRYGQKTSKMPQKWGFSPICDPARFFFKNRALSLLYPYGALTSCKKLKKSLERSLRYLKTDQRTDGPRTDMSDYIGPSRVNPGPKQVLSVHLNASALFLKCINNNSMIHIATHPQFKIQVILNLEMEKKHKISRVRLWLLIWCFQIHNT